MLFERKLILAAVVPALSLGLCSLHAKAQPIDYGALNAAVVKTYVLPRYADFAEAASALDASLTKACADGRLETAESADAFNDAMDAWMAVQHLRFGPSELFLRTERAEFWPDKRGMVRRHLALMLAGHDTKALEPETFANGSVAVQGFPALERLLYDSDAKTWATPFACRLTVAIGDNLKSIAAGMLDDWKGGDIDYTQVVLSAGDGNAHYLDAKEAALDFAKALRGALLLAEDYKLDGPLGKAHEDARVERAESWRSKRSLRNIAINLKAARALYAETDAVSFSALTRAQPQGAELDMAIRNALDRLVAATEVLPPSMAAVLDRPDGWQKLDAIRIEIRQLLQLVGGPLSQVLDLPIGFNSYDGD